MNRPKKITLGLLGIAASVGLGSLIAPPMPKKPLREGYARIECDKCGQEYDVSNVACRSLFNLNLEEIKHMHLSPQEEAEMMKICNLKGTP